MRNNRSKLKPCPFCGKELIKVHRWWTHPGTAYDCFEGTTAIPVDDEDAIKMWNERKPLDRLAEEIRDQKLCVDEELVPQESVLSLLDGILDEVELAGGW